MVFTRFQSENRYRLCRETLNVNECGLFSWLNCFFFPSGVHPPQVGKFSSEQFWEPISCLSREGQDVQSKHIFPLSFHFRSFCKKAFRKTCDSKNQLSVEGFLGLFVNRKLWLVNSCHGQLVAKNSSDWLSNYNSVYRRHSVSVWVHSWINRSLITGLITAERRNRSVAVTFFRHHAAVLAIFFFISRSFAIRSSQCFWNFRSLTIFA